jgi:predicted DCC family thiol-disulfide oxidoreductase YuxK
MPRIQPLRVAKPPPNPVMIYDGDCSFCRAWIERWKQATGKEVAYVPLQDRNVPVQLPEIPRANLERAVHLVDTTGNVYAGAEAVFRTLAIGGAKIPLWTYRHVPGVASITEAGYGLVARHRTAAWRLTRLLWGNNVLRTEYRVMRWLFLRLLGLIYLTAFWSLWVQIDGLIGSNGILPAARWTDTVRNQVDGYWYLQPSVIWLSASDQFLHSLCAIGVVCAIFVTLNVGTAPALVLLWLAYQALQFAGQIFLGYQWDALLLEVGFVAILFAPWRIWPKIRAATTDTIDTSGPAETRSRMTSNRASFLSRWIASEPEPSRVTVWLLRWVLFRLMFESGWRKFLGGDSAWSGLRALDFHYETQPLPTWIGWWAHQLPSWFQSVSVLAVLAIEMAVPLLIFLPRRGRYFAFSPLAALQILIALTGNYCFFNWLALALCLTLFDDSALSRFKLLRWVASTRNVPGTANENNAYRIPKVRPESRLKTILITIFAIFAGVVGAIQVVNMFVYRPIRFARIPQLIADATNTVNTYGLFVHMTRTRPEIVIQGSNDGITWLDYQFKYKPGEIGRRPGFVAPHQPRLDWQMWFAALDSYWRNPWLLSFMNRLLDGSPQVLELMATNPFPDAPPRHIRAIVYEYHFTDRETRGATGEWWRRELLGLYCPVLTRKQQAPIGG